MHSKGFTLIELVIAVTICVMIAAALYFSLKSALESWDIVQNNLMLQQVCGRLMEEIGEGLPEAYGIRDCLEVVAAGPDFLSVVMPWTDDTQSVYTGVYTYSLNRHIKPGTSLPISEALLPERKEYEVVPIRLVDQGKTEDLPQVFLRLSLPAGTRMRFTFHPDYQKEADVVTTFRYDSSENAVFLEDSQGRRNISGNPFGVKITDFKFRYFDNTNTEVGADGSVEQKDIPAITGVEISFTGQSKNASVYMAKSFIAMRNAPRRSGNIILHEGARIAIPNSHQVEALALANLSGIDNEDEIVLDAKPERGSDWQLTVKFSRLNALSPPLIAYYSIEYPSGNKVYSDRPKIPAESGLNLTTLGPGGLYDYDDDGLDEPVILEGKVTLEVKKMDIGGAAIFVRP